MSQIGIGLEVFPNTLLLTRSQGVGDYPAAIRLLRVCPLIGIGIMGSVGGSIVDTSITTCGTASDVIRIRQCRTEDCQNNSIVNRYHSGDTGSLAVENGDIHLFEIGGQRERDLCDGGILHRLLSEIDRIVVVERTLVVNIEGIVLARTKIHRNASCHIVNHVPVLISGNLHTQGRLGIRHNVGLAQFNILRTTGSKQAHSHRSQAVHQILLLHF